jgi:cytochrome c-type biogenesis protein
VLASQGERLGEVALVMAAFGLGATLPIVLLGMMSREAMLRLKTKLISAGRWLRPSLGLILLLIGVATLTGVDKRIEAALIDISPDWLGRLTTLY